MKKFLSFLAVLVALVGVYYVYSSKDTAPATETPSSTYRPDVSSATFVFDNQPITLSDGRAEIHVAPGSAITEELVLTDKVAYGELGIDEKDDAAVILFESGGGSGLFVYVAALISGPISHKGTNAIFVGDRIAPESISIDNKVITVTYLDRSGDEPLAAEPTIRTTKKYSYNGTELVEQ